MALFVVAVTGVLVGVLGCVRLARGLDLVPRPIPGNRFGGGHSRGPSMGLPVGGRDAAAAVLVGVVVMVVTRWPAAAVASGALVVTWRQLSGGGAAERASVAKVEAIAMWTESLRDTAQGASGLESAIPATMHAAPLSLQRPLRALVYRLSARVPLPEALALFADEVDDPGADVVVAALSLNARQRGGSLSRVLSTLAANTRVELEMRRRVLHERNAVRRTAQQVGGLLVLFVVGQAMLVPNWVAPYGTWLGQLVLGALSAAYVGLLVWLRRLAEPEPQPRFLTSADKVTEVASYKPRPVTS